MNGNRLSSQPSQVNLLDIYHAAQRIQYTEPTPAPQAQAPVKPTPSRTTPRMIDKLGWELKNHPVRYGAIGLAVVTLTAIPFQSHEQGKTVSDEARQDPRVVMVGDTNNSKPDEQTGDPSKLTFASLIGARAEVGSLQMTTVGGTGHIIYTRADNSTGTIDLPNVRHEQHVEIYAQPLLTTATQEGATPVAATPIAVTPKDDSYLVTIDRSKVGIVFDYDLPGKYKSTNDNAKVTTITLEPNDAADVFTMSFLPTTATPLIASQHNVSAAEATRANLIATASDQMAMTEAKVIALKQSIEAIQSAVSNNCVANAADQKPADTTGLVSRSTDAILKNALEKWANEHHRALYLEITGDYPLNYETTLQQYIASATVANSGISRESARDLETITTNRYARYFGVSAVGITCNPDAKLTSQG